MHAQFKKQQSVDALIINVKIICEAIYGQGSITLELKNRIIKFIFEI